MKNTIIIAFAVLLAACNQTETKQGFSVKGNIKNSADNTITLNEITNQGLIFLDSATIASDGSFELNGKVSQKTFCTITLPKGAVVLVLDSASDMVVSIDAETPDAFSVNGSPESEQLRQVMQLNNKYMVAMRGLENKYSALSSLPDEKTQELIRAEYDSILQSRRAELAQSAAQLNSVVPYFITNFLLPDANFEFLKSVDDRLYAQQSPSKYAAELHSRVEMMKKTAVGAVAPDIVQNDPFGKSVALSSLRGKYVLIDFWASWCRPCREENPNVVRMYNKYKSKGFDIFSVSLDDNRDAWMKAINDDRLLWTHVSDLTKWNSSVVKDYNIEGIPFTVLLDKDGKIIAKNLRGKALEDKLEELF